AALRLPPSRPLSIRPPPGRRLVAVPAVGGRGAAPAAAARAAVAAPATREEQERDSGERETPHISIYGATTRPGWTTSKADPGTRWSVWSWSFDHRGSGAPLKYQSDPLSATSIP